VGGFGAFFLLLDKPETYGLPPDPVDQTSHLAESWTAAAVAGAAFVAATVLSFVGARRRS
jgi:formate dehydrogenase iron-sulfur subunit